MPTKQPFFAQAVPSGFRLNPTILGPTQGDNEEARIRRLLDLARLAQLQQEPKIQQQQADLQRQRLALEMSGYGETGRHNVATEQLAQKSLEENVKQATTDALLKQMGFDVQQRGQDMTLQGGRETEAGAMARTVLQQQGESERANLASGTQTTDELIRVLGSQIDPTGEGKNLQTLAKVLALRKNPELLKVLMEGKSKTEGTGDPVADATLEYLKNKGAKPTSTPTNSSSGIGNLLEKLFIIPPLWSK